MEVISTFLIVVLTSLVVAVAIVAWIWHALRQSQEDYLARLDRQESEIDDLHRQIVELREGRIADHALLQEWIAYARRLATMFTEATGKEPPPEPQTQRRDVTADGRRLANLILVRFSESEMRDLAAELGIEGHVNGGTAAEYAGRLVTVARQRGLLLRLVELCRRDRPNGGF